MRLLEEYNKTKVKLFYTLTDEELLKEKEVAFQKYNYLQDCKSLKPIIATRMLGKIEWYITAILGEMKVRNIDGGFKYEKSPIKKVKLKKVCKYLNYKGYLLPKI